MKIDCVRFFVTDVSTFADWLGRVFGFDLVPDWQEFPWIDNHNQANICSQHTQVLKSGAVKFLISSPPVPITPKSTSPIYSQTDINNTVNNNHLSNNTVVQYLQKHPAGVGEIAFLVDDIAIAIARARKYGAKIITQLQQIRLDHQQIRWVKIAAWGSLQHILVERRSLNDPQKQSLPIPPAQNLDIDHLEIDHIVLNVPAGELIPATNWYKNILNLQPQQRFNIQTEKSGLCSQVMMSQCGTVQIPINEPSTPNSQIQEFLSANNGAGIQHIALRLPNLISAIAKFRHRGVQFLPIPQSYYTNLSQRHGFNFNSEELHAIAQQKILVDWQDNTPQSTLLQIFTQPIFNQPTFFFEFIERRRQAKGFGEGNFRALFTAIESEQAKRGSLQ